MGELSDLSLGPAPEVVPAAASGAASAAAAEAAASADPAVGLRAVRALQRLQERLEAIHVANARQQGWSWQAIADALGVSRQAVHQKYNRRTGKETSHVRAVHP